MNEVSTSNKCQSESGSAQITLALLEEQLLNIINYDPAKLVDAEGRFLLLNKIPANVRSAIAQYDPSASGPKVRGYSKITAIALVMKLKRWEQQGKEDSVSEEDNFTEAVNELKMPQLASMLSRKLQEEF